LICCSVCCINFITDEVDVIGSNDESDEQGSGGSDGGMIVTTKKLSLMDSL